jgi:hypothetical protein
MMKNNAARLARVCSAVAALAIASVPFVDQAQAARRGCNGVDYNQTILDIIRKLPTGGGYSVGSEFTPPELQVHNIGGGRTELRVYDGFPSHCTSATYALFTHLVATLHNAGDITLSTDQLHMLDANSRLANGTRLVDGQGPWWIFNSNGAGTAALAHHTGVGMNFRDDKLTYARPGDFMKIFWNGGVGKSESGHQVVYTGHREVSGREMVCFWGSQRQGKKKRGKRWEARYFPAQPGAEVHNGYGEVCRPREDIKEMIFTRVTCMEHLPTGLTYMQEKATEDGLASFRQSPPFKDEFLMSLRSKSSDHATLDKRYDILPAPSAMADVGPPSSTASIAAER